MEPFEFGMMKKLFKVENAAYSVTCQCMSYISMRKCGIEVGYCVNNMKELLNTPCLPQNTTRVAFPF